MPSGANDESVGPSLRLSRSTAVSEPRVWALWLFGATAIVAATSLLFPADNIYLGTGLGLVAWTHVWLTLRRARLSESQGAGTEPRARSLGLASLVTLARAWMISLLACFLGMSVVEGGVDSRWIMASALLYTLAAICDHLDGRLARHLQQVSRLGERLDMEVDAMGILVATLLAVQWGKLPLWFLLVGIARYWFVAGLWYRAYRNRPTADLHPSELRRRLAGFQMGFLSVSLFPQVPAEITLTAAWVFGGITLLVFARDWLVVSARWPARSSRYRLATSHTLRWTPWMLAVVRLGVGVLAVGAMPVATVEGSPILLWMTVLALVALLTGVGARIAAGWLIALISFSGEMARGAVWSESIDGIVVGCSLVLLLGPGPLPFRRSALEPRATARLPARAH